MIDVSKLTKNYERVQALKAISFTVSKGSFFALLGPNGAGKTTCIEILSTLKLPSGGSVTIDGNELGKGDHAIREKLGVVFQESVLDKILSVRENLMLRGRLYDLSAEEIKEKIEHLKSFIDIESFLDQRVETLSGGQRRRADLARALLNDPQILLLDEPTTGLDPQARENLWHLILKLKEETNMTIILTTHYMEEVNLADHVIILDQGMIKAEGSAEALRHKHAGYILKFIPKDEQILKQLKADNLTIRKNYNTYQVVLKDGYQGIELLQKHKDNMTDFEILKGTMDDVFLNITGRSLRD